MKVSRRDFIGSAAIAGAALPLGAADAGHHKGIPMRTLGRTGRNVTILVFGSGSRFLAYKEEDAAD